MVGQATILAMNDIIAKMDHSFLSKHESRAEQLADAEADAQQEALAALRNLPGQVMAAVSAEMVIVNIGSNNGLKIGDRLKVIKMEDIKNSQGEIVYSEEKEVGMLLVYEVQTDRARAKVVSGEIPQEGYTVKIQ